MGSGFPPAGAIREKGSEEKIKRTISNTIEKCYSQKVTAVETN